MIRYDISLAELLARIDRHKPTWRRRAAAATEAFRRAGSYTEPPTPFWGEIKEVYMRLQRRKCAFCERKLTVRRKDYDVEHFRPKRAVEPWPSVFPFPTGIAFPQGYFLLAYHPLNYVASCEHCNRGLKRSYFPIEAARIADQDDPAQLTPERPLLIYPIGRMDTDPEKLMMFNGIIPTPTSGDPNTDANHRARVTIAFFELDSREELRRERAWVIEGLFGALENEQSRDAGRRRRAEKIITRMTSERSLHTNCARNFAALYQQDPVRAGRIADLVTRYLDRIM